MSLPGVVAIMHPHDKARLDAALNKAARLDKRKGPLPQDIEEAKRVIGASPALGMPYKGGFDAVADAVAHGLRPPEENTVVADAIQNILEAGIADLEAAEHRLREYLANNPLSPEEAAKVQKYLDEKWGVKKPTVAGEPIDPDPRYGADDQGKAGWGNKNGE